mgnify:CR=1 FL=1|tara:strand:+ start:631 stop:822 length:192 start_codon:yes stop_codon:yes gene_type:complete
MNKSRQQFEHKRKFAKDIKRLYPINKSLQILESNEEQTPKYYLTNNDNFNKRIQTIEFIKLTK